MSGTRLSSADLSPRQRRVLFRAWHRGTREMDLMLGRFTDSILVDLDDAGLDGLEALLEVPDPELYKWLVGQAAVPPNHDTATYRALAAFQAANPVAGDVR
ncbi:MAG: succinate dehydrogenase assembly factor 2 [Pseudomonadota bacterium]